MSLFTVMSVGLSAALAVSFPATKPPEIAKAPPRAGGLVIEVKLVDDSVIKLTLLEERIEFVTPHGRLSIPAAEVRKVELGLRITDEVAKEIETAIADLGSGQYRKREEAMAILLRHRERAYPAVKRAVASTDAEVAKRAEELAEKLEATVPEARLRLPEHDILHTDLSKIAGKIVAPSLRARSFAFGDVQLKLADAVAMSTTGFGDDRVVADGTPDPGSLTNLQQNVGKTYTFKVTGAANGSVWGTDIYTLDSTLAVAAVHAGIVKVGQSGNVTVTILGPNGNYIGSTRNGVTTSNYMNYPGSYKIHMKEK